MNTPMKFLLIDLMTDVLFKDVLRWPSQRRQQKWQSTIAAAPRFLPLVGVLIKWYLGWPISVDQDIH